jgi:hypothetical protein
MMTVTLTSVVVLEGRTHQPGEVVRVPTEVGARLVMEGLAGAADGAPPLATWNTPAVWRR